jgi:hypothetical protein
MGDRRGQKEENEPSSSTRENVSEKKEGKKVEKIRTRKEKLFLREKFKSRPKWTLLHVHILHITAHTYTGWRRFIGFVMI